MTEVNQEIVIIMDGQWYVSSSVVKATSSSGVKATTRREDNVTVKYT
jgi:hypothetical protein